jgi:hypothetical protein
MHWRRAITCKRACHAFHSGSVDFDCMQNRTFHCTRSHRADSLSRVCRSARPCQLGYKSRHGDHEDRGCKCIVPRRHGRRNERVCRGGRAGCRSCNMQIDRRAWATPHRRQPLMTRTSRGPVVSRVHLVVCCSVLSSSLGARGYGITPLRLTTADVPVHALLARRDPLLFNFKIQNS